MALNWSTSAVSCPSLASTSAQLLPISFGLCTGPAACSSSDAARPSQNCRKLRLLLNTVGALIGPLAPPMPIEDGRPSTPPLDRLWQPAQASAVSFDKRLS